LRGWIYKQVTPPGFGKPGFPGSEHFRTAEKRKKGFERRAAEKQKKLLGRLIYKDVTPPGFGKQRTEGKAKERRVEQEDNRR